MTAPDPIDTLIAAALAEDVGSGDRTTEWTVPPEREVQARVVTKAPGVIAGIDAAVRVFRCLDPELRVEPLTDDGGRAVPGNSVIRLAGRARSILTGERVALNFLQRLSGIATTTRSFVDAIEGTGSRILDTRKTTPGMRALEKAAVRAGGGENHRFGLHDMVLIKENHIAAAGGLTEAVASVRGHNSERLAVEVEATNLMEVAEALAAGVDRILFDNMPLPMLAEAVRQVRSAAGAVETEASGGISLGTVHSVASTGVDFISVGALTHSAPALDLSLLVHP